MVPRSIWVPASRKLAKVSRVQVWGGQRVAKQRLMSDRPPFFLCKRMQEVEGPGVLQY